MDREQAPKRTMKYHCKRFGTCVRVSPWVPLVGCIMIITGLPVWTIYTRRALASTAALADALFGGRTPAVEQLSNSTAWVTGLGVIVVSCLAGVTLLVSLLRSYQEAARLPITKCTAPGKLSYGSYATLVSVVTFCTWAASIAAALLIAAQLSWLTLAFVFEAAITRGVIPAAQPTAPQAAYEAATALLSSIAANSALLPPTNELAKPAAMFAATSKQTPLRVCPASCVNLGSFGAAFGAKSSCVCGATEQIAALAGAASDTWKHLVHALAALALMGLAYLWLALNLSATFAHAKRDMRDAARAHGLPQPSGRGHAECAADHGRSKDLKSAARRDTMHDADTGRDADAYPGYAPLDAVTTAPAPIDAEARDCYASPAAPPPPAPAAAGGAADGGGARGSGESPAQRYAAYRLRAAQAAVGATKGDRRWG